MSRKCDLLEFAKTIYPQLKPDIKKRTIEGYVSTVNILQRFLGKQIQVRELDEEMLTRYFHHRLKVDCVSTYSCNRDRATIFALWEEAFEHNYHRRQPRRRKVRKMKEPKRIPKTWTQGELERLLAECKKAKPIPRRRKWTKEFFLGEHWVALVLVVYDTAHRIGTILTIRSDQLNDGLLTVQAEQTKQNREIIHKLHPQTIESIEAMPAHEMLIPWPLEQRSIYFYFRRILKAAGLSSTKRDMFHKLRRMSYTAVASEKGIPAATKHCGHSQDLSRFYLDPTKLKADYAVDYLPRPQIGPTPYIVKVEPPEVSEPQSDVPIRPASIVPDPVEAIPDETPPPTPPDVPPVSATEPTPTTQNQPPTPATVPTVVVPVEAVQTIEPKPVPEAPPAPVVEPTTTPQPTPAVSLPTEPRNGDRDVLSQFSFSVDTDGF